MHFFDGKYHASLLDAKIENFLKNNSVEKTLAIIMVGQDPSSKKYVELKKKYCEKRNIPVKVYEIESILSDEEIRNKVSDIFEDGRVGGGIIQMPLPRKSLNNLVDLIPVNKDVDLLSSQSLKKFYNGDFNKLSPVVRAFDYFIKNEDISLEGCHAAIVGDGSLVGKPVEMYLKNKGCDVTLISNYQTGSALDYQLIVLGAGVPALVNGSDICGGSSVVDFGSSVINGTTVGDLDLKSGLVHLNSVSPSPGGMGPLVIRFLIMNFLGI